MTTSQTAPPRRRNPRGEGRRLAEEIVDGALALIDRSGTDESVTLRSVAREVGIAAPSIYAHFEDREAILWAVMGRVFGEVTLAVASAKAAAGDDPVEQLVAGCEAYVTYGLEHPARYRAVFARQHLPPGCDDPTAPPPDGVPSMGGEAFMALVDGIECCVANGRSASTDPATDAVAVWIALHGAVSLWSTMCGFPWPDREGFVRRLVMALARITDRP